MSWCKFCGCGLYNFHDVVFALLLSVLVYASRFTARTIVGYPELRRLPQSVRWFDMLTTNLPEGSSFAFECIFQPEPICIAAIATERASRSPRLLMTCSDSRYRIPTSAAASRLRREVKTIWGVLFYSAMRSRRHM